MHDMNSFIRQAAGRQPAPADTGDGAPKLVARGTATQRTVAPTEPRATPKGNAGTGIGSIESLPTTTNETINAALRKARYYRSIEIKEILPR